jgi:hypothetical protein
VSTGTLGLLAQQTPPCPGTLSGCRGGIMDNKQEQLWQVHRELLHRTVSTPPTAEQCLLPGCAVASPWAIGFLLLRTCGHWLTHCASPALRHQVQKLLTCSWAPHTLNELPRCFFMIHGHCWGIGDATADSTVQRVHQVCCSVRRAQQRNHSLPCWLSSLRSQVKTSQANTTQHYSAHCL